MTIWSNMSISEGNWQGHPVPEDQLDFFDFSPVYQKRNCNYQKVIVGGMKEL